MKFSKVRLLAAAATFAIMASIASVSQAGIAPPTVSESFNGFELEFTINNPEPSAIGAIFGMAIAIDNQPFIRAHTENGWNATTLTSQILLIQPDCSPQIDEDCDDTVEIEVILASEGWSDSEKGPLDGLSWEAFSSLTVEEAFPGFEFDENSIILAFDSTNDVPEVLPGESLGGFFGQFSREFASQVVLVGNGATVTTDTITAPEPGTWALFGIGLAGLGAMVRRRRRSA